MIYKSVKKYLEQYNPFYDIATELVTFNIHKKNQSRLIGVSFDFLSNKYLKTVKREFESLIKQHGNS